MRSYALIKQAVSAKAEQKLEAADLQVGLMPRIFSHKSEDMGVKATFAIPTNGGNVLVGAMQDD